jgi:hypothetical protein
MGFAAHTIAVVTARPRNLHLPLYIFRPIALETAPTIACEIGRIRTAGPPSLAASSISG